MTTESDFTDWEAGPGLFESMWRFRWVVAGVVLLAVAAGAALSLAQTPMYEGKARLILSDPRNAGVFRETTRIVIDPSRYVRNQAEFITSTPVLGRAAVMITGPDVEEIRERVSAEAQRELDLIVIRALDPSAEGSAILANAVADAYQEVVAEEVRRNAQASIDELERAKAELQAQIDSLETELAANPDDAALEAQREAAVSQLITLDSRAEQIAVDAALYGSGVELFEPAETPERPAQPNLLQNLVLATVLGLMAASALAWWLSSRSQVAEDRSDPGRVLGVPLLGQVPEFKDVGITSPLPTLSTPGSPVAESYQFVISSIEYSLNEVGGTTILVTSPRQEDGKTVTAANLALAAARDGRKVLLVDADERARGLSRFGGSSPEPGLTDFALQDLKLEDCLRQWWLSDNIQMPVMPAGSKLETTSGFFRTPGFRKAMDRIKGHADLVVVDSPPLLAVADASAIAAQTDGIVLVVRQGTPLRLLDDARRHLEFVGVPLIGYVFNRARMHRIAAYAAGYGYGYGYGGEKRDRLIDRLLPRR